MFDPNDITQADLHKLRSAAEAAWSDETRHEKFVGHPHPSAGQCYVTSRWMTGKLGGQVGVKNGHYFWVSPDKKYVVDLTGDQFTYEPTDPRLEGLRLDDEDAGHIIPEDHKTHRPGPVVYVKADHPLYNGFRIQSDKQPGQDRRDWLDIAHSADKRVKLFQQRADHAYDTF